MCFIAKIICRNALFALTFCAIFQASPSYGQYREIEWPQSPNPYSGFDNIKVDFSDKDNGCLSGTVFYSPSTGESYHFFTTHDGGQSWTEKSSQSDISFYSYLVSSINSGLSFAGYGSSVFDNLWRVSDSGDTWYNYFGAPNYFEVPQKIIKYNDQYQFLLAKSYLCDSFSCQVLYRLEGEVKTELFRTRTDTIIIKTADFLTPDNGFLITSDPVDSSYSVRKTTNGGSNFAACFTTDSLIIYDIEFFNDSTGMISCSGGYLFKTMDYGMSWNPVVSGVTANIHVLSFIDDEIGYFGGSGYAFYRTADQGETWSQLPNPPKENVIRLNMLQDGLGWIQCDYEGFCYLYSGPESRINENEPKPFDIYPNPASESINVRFHEVLNEVYRVSLFNITGIPVMTPEIFTSTSTIDINFLPPGIYILLIGTVEDQWTERIIKL